jgi:hypothetical protein
MAVNVYGGNYELSNVSGARPLLLAYFQYLQFCGIYLPPPNYLLFQSLSDNATLYGCLSNNTIGILFSTTEHSDFSVNGFFPTYENNTVGQFVVFPAGIYTIFGGDEWGDAVILHVTVVT